MMSGDVDHTIVHAGPASQPQKSEAVRQQDWGGHLLKPGDAFDGNLRIMARIGEGGMGEIYAAVDEERRFAIKLIRADMSADFDQDDMLRKEAAALEGLKSRFIVKYHYRRRDPISRRPYIAMELVEGNRNPVEGVPESWRAYSLKDHLIDDGALKVSQVLALARCLAEGLAAAHTEGVFHRDLSPGNILLRNGDLKQPVIIDFGIAKVQRGEERTMVRAEFRGTCNYASPEHFSQAPIEAPSDLYGLGLVLAAASLGRPLDMGQQDPMRAAMLRQTVPKLDGVPGRLRPLLTWLLQPKARNRPQSARELLLFLDKRQPVIWAWRNRRGFAATVALLLAAAIAIPLLWPKDNEQKVPPPPPSAITETAGSVSAPSVNGDPSVAVSPPVMAPEASPLPSVRPPPPSCAASHPDAPVFAAPACKLVDMLALIGMAAVPDMPGAIFPQSSPEIRAGEPMNISLSGTLPTPAHVYYIAVSDDGSVIVAYREPTASGLYKDRVEAGDTRPGWTLFAVVTSAQRLPPLDRLSGTVTDINILDQSLHELSRTPDRGRKTSWTLVRVKA